MLYNRTVLFYAFEIQNLSVEAYVVKQTEYEY
jgi:hypothetical protein